jgi:hypothetical protein
MRGIPGKFPLRTRQRTCRILPVIAVLLLMGFLCGAANAASNASGSAGSIEIRQAHLAWTALDKEYEMNTAVTYCGTLYGSDTSNMTKLLGVFRVEESRIPATATGAGLDSLIEDMRTTTTQFRKETRAVMTKGQGKWNDLNLQIIDAKENNPYILAKKDAYWETRKAYQLAAFDAWGNDGQQLLGHLNSGGYNTTAAQRALDVFQAQRPAVLAALTARSETDIASVNLQTLALSTQFGQKVVDTQEQVPDSIRFAFFIDEGYRAVERADQVNPDLTRILLDIGDADAALAKTKTDLATARKVLGTGNLESARIPLKLVQKDMVDLAQAYRDLAHRVDLPDPLSSELNTLINRLTDTTDRMGAVL